MVLRAARGCSLGPESLAPVHHELAASALVLGLVEEVVLPTDDGCDQLARMGHAVVEHARVAWVAAWVRGAVDDVHRGLH
eukprot:9347-Eustigmatos_ZCMA.PRE.1